MWVPRVQQLIIDGNKEKCTGKNKQEQNNSKSSRLACIEENILRDNNLVKYQALLQQQFGPNWTEPSKYE